MGLKTEPIFGINVKQWVLSEIATLTSAWNQSHVSSAVTPSISLSQSYISCTEIVSIPMWDFMENFQFDLWHVFDDKTFLSYIIHDSCQVANLNIIKILHLFTYLALQWEWGYCWNCNLVFHWLSQSLFASVEYRNRISFRKKKLPYNWMEITIYYLPINMSSSFYQPKIFIWMCFNQIFW